MNDNVSREILKNKQRLESSISILAKSEFQKVKVASRTKKIGNPFVYFRLIVIATFLGIENKYSLDSDELQTIIIDKLMNSLSLRLTVVAILMILDEFQYKLMLQLHRAIPNSSAKPIVNLLRMIGESMNMVTVNDDTIYEAFYIAAHSSNMINLKEYEYKFDTLSLQEKQKYVTMVVGHTISFSLSIESSYFLVDILQIYKLYDNARLFYSIYKVRRLMESVRNEITSARVVNVITEKIKTAIIRLLSRFTSSRLRILFRSVMDLLVGPLAIASLIDTTKQIEKLDI